MSVTHQQTRWRQIKRGLCRTVLTITGLWLTGIVLFGFLPVPFTTVMAERQISAWWQGDWHYRAHSQWVPLDQISAHMVLAVIAAEDQQFPQHKGFDIQAIRLALQHNEQHSNTIRGASTLSQQTAKNLFLWSERSWLRKGLEAGLTVAIEMLWSKKRILTVYLNIAEFGHGLFGVEAAAQHYFHKPASALSPHQAALLASVLPNPVRYNPASPDARLYARQQRILRQMQQLGGNAFLVQHALR